MRHLLFYSISIVFIVAIYYFIKETWILSGWVRYSNNAELNLSDFNSIFELCVAFSLAYTVIIKFRSTIKKNAYNNLNKRLDYVKEKSQVSILGTDREYRIVKFILSNIVYIVSDITLRMSKEEELRKENSKHRAEDPFLYFGFYSLLCIITGSLIQGLDNRGFRFEVYLFLLLFSISSALTITAKYKFSKRPSFTIVIILFLINVITCLSIARNTDINDLFPFFYSSIGQSYLFSENNDFKTAINYCCLLCVFINLFPYVLFFRKLYYVFIMYTCAAYQFLLLLYIEEGFRLLSQGAALIINVISFMRSSLADLLELLAKIIRGK